MKRQQAYVFALDPNQAQAAQLRQFAGDCRWVWNQALAHQQRLYAEQKKKLGYAGLCKLLTAWRNDASTPWLKDTPSSCQQQALKDLDRAYGNFFAKRAELPRFRKKGDHERFRFPSNFTLDQHGSRIKLPKIGWVRYRNSREALGTLRNVTVSLRAGRWFIAIQTERQVDEPVHPSSSSVGVDLGIVRFATLSNGTVYAPAGSLQKHASLLARAQRQLARKKKFSQRRPGRPSLPAEDRVHQGPPVKQEPARTGCQWKKAKARAQKIQARIANVRKDHQHKVSTAICKSHAVVVVEDLKVKNMSRSAAGTIEKPGKRVRAKAGLNRSILDQGWGEFRRQLAYKLAWAGGKLVAVPPANTSRRCPACGHVAAENRPAQAVFRCCSCGLEEHADLVAALNILASAAA